MCIACEIKDLLKAAKVSEVQQLAISLKLQVLVNAIAEIGETIGPAHARSQMLTGDEYEKINAALRSVAIQPEADPLAILAQPQKPRNLADILAEMFGIEVVSVGIAPLNEESIEDVLRKMPIPTNPTKH